MNKLFGIVSKNGLNRSRTLSKLNGLLVLYRKYNPNINLHYYIDSEICCGEFSDLQTLNFPTTKNLHLVFQGNLFNKPSNQTNEEYMSSTVGKDNNILFKTINGSFNCYLGKFPKKIFNFAC